MVLTKLENKGYEASKNSKFYLKETIWLESTIQKMDRIQIMEKLANRKHKTTNKHKITETFLGASQNFAKQNGNGHRNEIPIVTTKEKHNPATHLLSVIKNHRFIRFP